MTPNPWTVTPTEAKDREKRGDDLGETTDEAGIRTRRQKRKGEVSWSRPSGRCVLRVRIEVGVDA